MSHFCLSRSNDSMVNFISLSGRSEATAYIWGGASGNEYGQILDIWCELNNARIAANESSPPPNWIVSYTIPSAYLGATFVGVKPNTRIRETANSVFFGLETAQEAKSRADRSANVTVPLDDCPRFLSDVWSDLLVGTKKFEGCIDFMYNDKSSPQLVTVGVGKMFDDLVVATQHKNYFLNPAGNIPEPKEIENDFNRAHGLKRTEGNLYEFATITLLRMPLVNIHKLLTSFMAVKVGPLPSMFSEFGKFPSSAKIACASIAYGGWGHPCFDLLKEAVRAKEWNRAAEVYKSPHWDPQKDAWHRGLFRAAAQGG
jgi:hypothetical protein